MLNLELGNAFIQMRKKSDVCLFPAVRNCFMYTLFIVITLPSAPFLHD